MEFKISTMQETLKIDTAVEPENKKELMEEFRKCAEGKCSCPSKQYEKLSSINVVPHTHGVSIELTPRKGETIDRDDIERCLAFTAEKLKPTVKE